MAIEFDIMSTQEGHTKLTYENIQEFDEKMEDKDEKFNKDALFDKLQNGWILSAEMSDGTTQMIANQYTKQGQISKIVRQLSPSRLLLRPPISAG